MSIAIIHRMPEGFTTEQYDAVNEKAAVTTDPPAGLIHHTVGTSDSGAVMIDVWESEEAFESFRDDRLNPALESIVGTETFAEMPAPEREFYAVHNTVSP
ncbi:MAG: hypothetical protein QOI10_1185 [Solirubrobacterales bacterium]|jgi:hypothetical protein|nr:hypothetical protein [Solirubrobacterales bacterium]